MATTKKKSPAKKAAPALQPLNKLKTTHAAKLMNHVNGLLAAQGFAAKVSEVHFVPSGGGEHNCDNCLPPNVCKRVCFMNSDGEPECEDRCVSPPEA